MTKILKATSGRLFGRVTAGTGRAEELTPSEARTLLELGTLATQSGTFSGTSSGTNTGDQNLFSTIVVSGQSNIVADGTSDSLTIVAGANISITTDASTDALTIASTAGGLSGTGSVDNAALRADGTGGATLQSSAWIINDNLTASPNNTVNHACLEATGGTTNVSVSIKPKGTGAFCLAAPDGTATGGNARGANAIDLQTLRTAATQVASTYASIVIGVANTATGQAATAIGLLCNAVGPYTTAIGQQTNATSDGAVAIGRPGTTASGNNSFAANGATASNTNAVAFADTTASAAYSTAFGLQGVADRYNQFVHGGGYIASGCGFTRFVLGIKTTNATPTILWMNGTLASVRLTIPSGKVLSALCRITGIKSDGTAVSNYVRRVVIKNVSGTTSLVGSVETIGTDIEDNAATDVSITADNTNDALQIEVTGIAGETWRWLAVVEGLELVYGT